MYCGETFEVSFCRSAAAETSLPDYQFQHLIELHFINFLCFVCLFFVQFLSGGGGSVCCLPGLYCFDPEKTTVLQCTNVHPKSGDKHQVQKKEQLELLRPNVLQTMGAVQLQSRQLCRLTKLID